MIQSPFNTDDLLSPPDLQVPLDQVLANNELESRSSKAPNFEDEAKALTALAESLLSSPETILQKLSDVALELCGSDSAGVSIAEIDGKEEIFRWHAVSGKLAPFKLGTMPRDFSPCGHVVRTKSHHLMVKMIGHYGYISKLGLPLYEVLLVPFEVGGKPVGTMWVVAHGGEKKFDVEDLRVLKSLTRFASVAYQTKLLLDNERRSAHAAEQARDQLHSFFMQAPAPMVIFSGAEHKFLLANSPYESYVGRKVMGRNLADVFTEEEVGYYTKILDRVYKTNEPYVGRDLPLTLKDESGKTRDLRIDVSYTPFHDEADQVAGILVFVQDVTEQYLARLNIEKTNSALLLAKSESDRANDAKSAFLANMSHEIRTPIGAIMGFSDLAQQPGATSEEVAAYLSVVERNSVQVLRIIDDILDLAKVEAGRVELEIIEISVGEFLADFISLISLRARENGISLSIDATSDLPEKICTDPTRLRQILTNAVGNAIKFTQKGSVTIHVRSDGNSLAFDVVDTGRGISGEQSKQLFQAFVQADTSTTRKFGGTGLGLVLTKRLCQLMGGDYSLVESELGKGSTFRASIKFLQPEMAKVVSKSEMAFELGSRRSAKTGSRRLEGVSVLLVEDSTDNQVLIRLILERQGAKIQIASDGQEGVSKALAGHHDIVLMDIQMPIMDGHESMQTLRQKRFKTPVVALTAHAMKEETERAFRSGFTTFLTKPVQREILIDVIGKLTDSKSSRH